MALSAKKVSRQALWEYSVEMACSRNQHEPFQHSPGQAQPKMAEQRREQVRMLRMNGKAQSENLRLRREVRQSGRKSQTLWTMRFLPSRQYESLAGEDALLKAKTRIA